MDIISKMLKMKGQGNENHKTNKQLPLAASLNNSPVSPPPKKNPEEDAEENRKWLWA